MLASYSPTNRYVFKRHGRIVTLIGTTVRRNYQTGETTVRTTSGVIVDLPAGTKVHHAV